MIFKLKRKIEKGERNDKLTRRSKSKAYFAQYVKVQLHVVILGTLEYTKGSVKSLKLDKKVGKTLNDKWIISVRGLHLQSFAAQWQIYGRDQLDMPQNAYEAIVCVKYVVCNDRRSAIIMFAPYKMNTKKRYSKLPKVPNMYTSIS